MARKPTKGGWSWERHRQERHKGGLLGIDDHIFVKELNRRSKGGLMTATRVSAFGMLRSGAGEGISRAAAAGFLDRNETRDAALLAAMGTDLLNGGLWHELLAVDHRSSSEGLRLGSVPASTPVEDVWCRSGLQIF